MSDLLPARAARTPSKVADVLRLLGALLCVSGASLMVGAEVLVLIQRTAIEHAQYAACVAAYPYQAVLVPPPEAISGPQQDLCLAPAAIALLVIGVRVLLGKSPGVAPPAATLLGVGGAVGMCALLFPLSFFSHSFSPCPFEVAGRNELLFWLGLLVGLVGSIVLSRTTRYRPLRLEDA